MKTTWLNTVFPIAALFSFRMLGLFMLIPVFTVYAPHLHNATPTLIGIALGGYGLSQGLLQIPFGMLSDRIGRKPIIAVGFIFFIIGSMLGAITDSIYGMILARILQGMGAVGSVLIALLADLTTEEKRTRAMASVGGTIGLSFILSMVLSPAIASYYGLSGIFYICALLGVAGIILLYGYIPTPKKEPFHPDSNANPLLLKSVITNQRLLRLDFSIFCQHFILTATFYVLPLLLLGQIKAGHLTHTWHFYLPQMLLSFILMLPFIVLAERKQQMRPVFLSAVFLTGLCQFVLALSYDSWILLSMLTFFYLLGFNFLEASLPSLVSKIASPKNKGTAMGVYSSSQFLGIFAGGTLAGLLFHFAGFKAVLLTNGFLAFIWFMLTFCMTLDMNRATLLIHYPHSLHLAKDINFNLKKIPGILKATISKEENLIYLQIDSKRYKPGSAEAYLKKIS